MPIRLPASLRGRLILFLTAVFAVLFGALLLQQAESRRYAREAAQSRALDLARGYARHYERLVRDHVNLLDTLKHLRRIEPAEPVRCEDGLKRIVAATPSLANLLLVDEAGAVRCGAVGGSTLGAAEAATVRRALEHRGPMLGMSGEADRGRPYLALAQPLDADAERPNGVLVAFLDRDWLNARFAETLPSGVVLRIFDGDGIFVVRQPDPACCVGKSGRHLGGIGEAIADGREQVTTSLWLDGVTRLQADLPLKAPLAGVVSIGIPEELVVTDAERGTKRLAWLLAALCLALYAITWYFSDRAVLRPLRALAEGAQRLRRGELDYRIPSISGKGEFVGLANDFNRMADTLEARRNDIERDMDKLKLAAQVFAQASEAITITDAEANILSVNPRFSEITGYAAEEVIGRNPRILQSGRQDAAFYRAMWDTLAGKGRWSGEIWNRRKDGKVYPEWLSISAVRDTAGRTANYVAVFTDLTFRKATDEALRESRERLTTLIESIPDAIFFKDGDSRWQVVNGAARRLFGLDGLPWQGLNDLELALINPAFSGEHMASWNSDEDAWMAGQAVHFTENVHLDEGSTAIFDVTKVPLYDDAGGRHALIVVGRDVTALRRNAEELERRVAERTHELETANRELESFSYSISHDLRAPLRAINGFSRLIEEESAATLDDKARDYLARVRLGSVRMGELIDDLLELSRVSRYVMKRETVDLSALAAEIAGELQASEPDRRVEWTIAPGITAVCDLSLMRSVLTNLLGNAWKYTSKRERARIEFGTEEPAPVAPPPGSGELPSPPLPVRGAGERRFFVRDNGAGFDMRYAEKLFGAFQRLHAPSEFPGSGIGLATVARIIHRHDGEVWAEGKVDEGATFYYTLSTRRLNRNRLLRKH
jgi:PAS domain S-box-containing protein